jgi:hypothetical protein
MVLTGRARATLRGSFLENRIVRKCLKLLEIRRELRQAEDVEWR